MLVVGTVIVSIRLSTKIPIKKPQHDEISPPPQVRESKTSASKYFRGGFFKNFQHNF